MTVISERSLSPNATLTTRAGRVFPAMPKSISQTSPRRGIAILSLKGCEERGRGSAYFLIFKRDGIQRQAAAQRFLSKGALLSRRKMLEGVQRCLGLAAHACILPAPHTGMKGDYAVCIRSRGKGGERAGRKWSGNLTRATASPSCFRLRISPRRPGDVPAFNAWRASGRMRAIGRRSTSPDLLQTLLPWLTPRKCKITLFRVCSSIL